MVTQHRFQFPPLYFWCLVAVIIGLTSEKSFAKGEEPTPIAEPDVAIAVLASPIAPVRQDTLEQDILRQDIKSVDLHDRSLETYSTFQLPELPLE
ncbi:MAG: hypothetical protein HY785_06025 [Oscillatoriophycideae cyanobacterium NC_groundwater_1537_Pr4_S-0.65um_50_18]|nr:hypothetical protein [Oscillatoriophycideae cyanobacterium NC_groundwater_1537_Pr4_S-0.65um_50_18]